MALCKFAHTVGRSVRRAFGRWWGLAGRGGAAHRPLGGLDEVASLHERIEQRRLAAVTAAHQTDLDTIHTLYR
jgi:hypothetical protein